MDEREAKVYVLMRGLEKRAGFAMNEKGVFTYWGVPLDEIPIEPTAELSRRFTVTPAYYPIGLSMADYYHVADAVDRWFARRHLAAAEEA